MRQDFLAICLFAVLSSIGSSAASATRLQILTDRLANVSNDYVFVVADGGFGFAQGSREALATAVASGADAVALHVRKDASGTIMVNDDTTFSQALATIRDQALVMVDGCDGFPLELVEAYRRSRGEIAGLILNSKRTLAEIRVRTIPAGLTDPVVQAIYRRRCFYVPTVLPDGSNFDAAIDIHYLRLAEVQVSDPGSLSGFARVRGYKSGTKLMIDTTTDATSAGHGDLRALPDPEANWGWCLAQGARAIRTGRPAELIRYLDRLGRHDLGRHGEVLPYAAEAGFRLSLVPALVPAPRELTQGKGLVPADAPVRTVRDAALPREGYRLETRPEGILIASADEDGEYWARQTLEQLRGEVNGLACYPVVTIRDWPQFSWRGALMDDSRHFIGKEGVKLFLDAMAKHKLNVFHWHPDDDQGWRLPLAGFPDLQQYGSTLKKRNGKLYGPFAYTAEEVREILAYAKARHIKVVPEFEIPGHNRALVCSYPEISCVSSRPQKCIPRDGSCFDNGVEPNSICAGDDAAIATVERMLDALMALFPDSDTIHIGGDEVNYNWWKKCPNCQARIKKLGLKDEKALQSWLVRHFVAYLAKHGRKAIGWDEVVDGGIPENFQVMYWRGGGYQSHRIAATNGTGVVMCPSSHCYFDKDALLPNDKYAGFGACTMRNAYSFDPYAGIPADRRDCVMGTQGLLWGEMIASTDELIWKAYPRLCVTAEIGWTNPPLPRDYDGFLKRLGTHIPRLRAWGIGCAPTQEGVP